MTPALQIHITDALNSPWSQGYAMLGRSFLLGVS